jgi:DnaJ-domain-containing protein 1
LERLGIDALESLFARPNLSEDELLDLKEELEIRTTLRARTLCAKVVGRLAEMHKAAAAPVRQAVTPVPVKAPASPVTAAIDKGAQQESLFVGSAHPTASANSSAPAIPVAITSPEMAYKSLKLTAAASWEQIEQTRREQVAKAQPDKLVGLSADKRRALQDEAQLANAAYRFLIATRL